MDGPYEVASEFAAKRLDVGIHRARSGCIDPVPYVLEELLAREDSSGCECEAHEQVVFGGGEVRLGAATCDSPRVAVDVEVAEFDRGGRVGGCGGG